MRGQGHGRAEAAGDKPPPYVGGGRPSAARLRPGQRSAIAAIADRLGALSDGEANAIDDVIPTIGVLLGLDVTCAYGVTVTEGLCAPNLFAKTRAFRPWMIDKWLGFLRGAKPTFGLYDASRPEPRQRNRALALADFGRDRVARTALAPILVRIGLDRSDQLRALVCDGPSLLAWVGGFRHAPFVDTEKAALQALVPSLRRRLRLERQLGEQRLRAAALPAAMEGISAPAFLVGATGRVLHANAAGRTRLACGRLETLEALRVGRGFSRTRVSAPGLPELSLAVQEAPPDDPAPRVDRAAARWALSPRERQVLALLVRGDANKTIAVALRVGEGAVETYVTRLLAKAQVEGRAALAAKFWAAR